MNWPLFSDRKARVFNGLPSNFWCNVFMNEEIKLGLSFMKVGEVAVLLREIVDRCPSLDGSTITLVPQKAMFPLFRGYHINIKANFTPESMGGLRKIVEGHDLAMKIKSDSVLIYEQA